jgi:uncharacterized phiE125 gp8 family phage protein
MQLQRITRGTFPLVANERVRRNSRIDDRLDDDWISEAVREATDFVERYLECCIATSEWKLTLDRFPPKCEPIQIPLWPVTELIEIRYLDAALVAQTIPVQTVFCPMDPSQRSDLRLIDYKAWPETRRTPGAVEVKFKAGWLSPCDVPGSITRATLMLVSHWYEHRETAIEGQTREVDFGTTQMLELARPCTDLIA